MHIVLNYSNYELRTLTLSYVSNLEKGPFVMLTDWFVNHIKFARVLVRIN